MAEVPQVLRKGIALQVIPVFALCSRKTAGFLVRQRLACTRRCETTQGLSRHTCRQPSGTWLGCAKAAFCQQNPYCTKQAQPSFCPTLCPILMLLFGCRQCMRLQAAGSLLNT